MLRPLCTLGAGLALLCATPAAAQKAEAPPPIREFDLPTVERLGRVIWRQDVAGARATDALRKQVPDLTKEKLVGWLALEDGANYRVRFLRDPGGGVEAAYDVAVPERGEPRVSVPADRSLTSDELVRFTAIRTAASGVQRTCRPGYNSAVVKDVDGEGWLVWLLAPSPASGVVPMGGHYRFTVSEDGRRVERRDALSASCMLIDPRQGLPKGAQAVGVVASHIVSPTPVETHVFLQLLYRAPFYVVTGPEMWKIQNGRVGKAPKR